MFFQSMLWNCGYFFLIGVLKLIVWMACISATSIHFPLNFFAGRLSAFDCLQICGLHGFKVAKIYNGFRRFLSYIPFLRNPNFDLTSRLWLVDWSGGWRVSFLKHSNSYPLQNTFFGYVETYTTTVITTTNVVLNASANRAVASLMLRSSVFTSIFHIVIHIRKFLWLRIQAVYSFIPVILLHGKDVMKSRLM